MTERGNVTPFRRRRPPQRTPGESLRTPRGRVLLMHGLTFAAFGLSAAPALLGWPQPLTWLALGFGVAAAAIAAQGRSEGMPWACTHHEMGVRTIIGGAAMTLLIQLAGLIPGVGGFAGWGLLAVLGWVLLRALVGFVRGLLRLPCPRPETLLV